jgi:hypothetical protein
MRCYYCQIGYHTHHRGKERCWQYLCMCTEMPKEDIYKDLFCPEDKAEPGLSGYWSSKRSIGDCNACYSGDKLSNYEEQVFVIVARSLQMRLCIGHLKKLVSLSRYR